MRRPSDRLVTNLDKKPLKTAPPWLDAPSRQIILWHGCTESAAQSILRGGIDLAKAQEGSDFGPGFYTTSHRLQAELWAWGAARNSRELAYVLQFTLSREAVADLSTLCFVRHDFYAADLWSFISHCRKTPRPRHRPKGSRTPHYDMVIGPVAVLWEQRQASPDHDQRSFHTARSVKLLNAEIRHAKVRRFKVTGPH